MSMNAAALSAALREKFVDEEIMTDSAEATAFCDAIAEVLIDYITTNAEVDGGSIS